jgi:putative flippase GtrA
MPLSSRNPRSGQGVALLSAMARTMRYSAVGGLCMLINNVIIIGGARFGIHYVAATVAAFFVTTPLGYTLHTMFTFGARLSWQAFLRFAAGIAMSVPSFLVLMALLCTGLGLPVGIATPAATVMAIVLSYATAHWAILGFRQK